MEVLPAPLLRDRFHPKVLHWAVPLLTMGSPQWQHTPPGKDPNFRSCSRHSPESWKSRKRKSTDGCSGPHSCLARLVGERLRTRSNTRLSGCSGLPGSSSLCDYITQAQGSQSPRTIFQRQENVTFQRLRWKYLSFSESSQVSPRNQENWNPSVKWTCQYFNLVEVNHTSVWDSRRRPMVLSTLIGQPLKPEHLFPSNKC